MSNFNTLLENKDYNELVGQVVQESFNDLMNNLNEEDLARVQEYSDLLKEKKLKRSLEEEISEAIMPILEVNTVLYGTFLYETEAIEEGCCTDSKNILENLREMLGKETIAEMSDTAKRRLKTAGKTAAGLGAAGLGAAGLGAAGEAPEGDTPDTEVNEPNKLNSVNKPNPVNKLNKLNPMT